MLINIPCKHEKFYLEFRDQYPRDGEEFDPKANGLWRVCANEDCDYEEQGEWELSLSKLEKAFRDSIFGKDK